MNKWTPRWRGMSRLIVLSTILIAAGHAHATTVPVTGYIVINPIDVCDSTGPSGPSGCAAFNTLDVSPNPAQATTATPIGFVDPPTNVNVTRAIWLQMGIDVTFLPIQEFNNSNYEAIDDISCTTTNCTSTNKFHCLSTGLTTGFNCPAIGRGVGGCKSNCTVPLALPKTNAINMFFVDQITGTGGSYAGFAWLNNNGVAISAAQVFSFSSLLASRFDTIAHELGHNLNLDHATFGADILCSGVPTPDNGCNVMHAGTTRFIPTSSGCSPPNSPPNAMPPNTDGGALFDLDTGLCGTSMPAVPQADQLILGTSSTTQQGQALLTGFLNPIPNVNATAGGGDVAFTVTAPKLKTFGGRTNESIVALVLALPQGFKFGTNPFVETGGTGGTGGTGPTLFGSPGFELLNGNNGQGNSNCLKPLNGGPSIECLEIDFEQGTFTANTSISFTSDIINKSTGLEATLADLACAPPETGTQCLDLTYVFDDLLATSSAFVVRDKTGVPTANSQLPDAGVTTTIVDPTNFRSIATSGLTFTNVNFPNQIPCTASSATSCPPRSGGSWLNSGE